MSDARANILQRLRTSEPPAPASQSAPAPGPGLSQQEKATEFSRMLESVRGLVLPASRKDWQQTLHKLLADRGVKRLLIGPGVWPGSAIAEAPPDNLELVAYEDPVETWKETLFNDIDAAITGVSGAIARTGSLVLWPSPAEPRLMSLVPPLHIVVMNADQLYDSFDEIAGAQNWADGMPTNALLISGPSKSADIEQVLAYGVHGPKDLVVLLCD